MKLRLKPLKQFSGEAASFYTIIVDEEDAKFSTFINENLKKYENELIQMMSRFKAMGTITGATDNFFKLEESANPNDKKVVCYYDIPDKKFRLFCIKMSDKLIILGGGGEKLWYHIKWQDSKKLKKEGEFIMMVSELIDLKMQHGELGISKDDLHFTGNLEIK